MSGHAVRKAFIRQFVGFQKYPSVVAYGIVASYGLQLAGAIGFGYWLLQHPFGLSVGLMLAATMLFIGTRLRGFNNIVHECSHATFADSLKDNVRCGSICASMVLGCFKDYRAEHMTHHAHLGDYDKDMDLQGIRDLHLEAPITFFTVLRHILTPLVGLHLPYYLGANLSRADGVWFLVFKLALIAATGVFTLLDPIAALVLIWVPFVWVYSSINYWTDCLDHGGLLDLPDELQASRNIAAPTPVKLILFPRNDCFHLVHHLFPQIPARHLAVCHERLLAHSDYRHRPVGKRGIPPLGVAGAA